MIITKPVVAFLAFVPVVIVLIVLRANQDLFGRRWLFAFVVSNACLFLLVWLPAAISYMGLWRIAVVVEGFLQVHGFWFSALISMLGWFALVVFVLRQHPAYQGEQRLQHGFKIDADSGKQIVEVEMGFSWPAFFLGAVWAFYKRMPGIGVALVVGNIIVAFGMDLIIDMEFSRYAWTVMPTVHIPEWVYDFVASTLLVLGWLFLVGFFGNAWYCWSLERKNYQRIG